MRNTRRVPRKAKIWLHRKCSSFTATILVIYNFHSLVDYEFILAQHHTQIALVDTDNMASRPRLDSPDQNTLVAWIAALSHELAVATAVLNEEHERPASFE